MCKVPVRLRELVKQRLDAAAEEIFELLERTITEYEEEIERQRRLMETMLQPRVLLDTTAVSGLQSVQPEEGSLSQPQDPLTLHVNIKEEEDPLPAHIKEEQEEASSSQEALHRDITSQLWKRDDTAPFSDFDEVLTTTQVSMKSEEEEAPEIWTQPLYYNQTVACPEPPVTVAASGDTLLHHNKGSITEKPNKCQKKNRNLVQSHVCPHCDKVFQWKCMLDKHIRVHTGETPFSCSVCGRKFSHKGNLESHLLIHSEIRQFICSVCGKRFAQKSGLNNHILLHSGEKPFSCSVCGKRFAQKKNVEQHMMVHSGLKPYSCTVCGKAFSQKSNLYSHMPVHSREKHFKCSVCGKEYRQRTTLSQHMSTHK